ncbi:MAG: translation initiation factor IF-2 subunit alpha [Candidatus Bathyarchaeia archaeon]
MSNSSIEREYPEVGDFVVATVSKVVDYGAYARLDEYAGKEGLVHISEVSSTWVKNIRDHLKEGQKVVLKVLRVNPERNQIDLSLRRVSQREKTEKMIEWKMERKAESILKGAAERLKADQATLEKIRETLSKNFESIYDAFEEAIESDESHLIKVGIPEAWAKALLEVARAKIKVEKVRLKATVEAVCEKPSGIEAIREALIKAKKIRKPRSALIRIYTIGAPKYCFEVVAKNYIQAEKLLTSAIDEALESIKNSGGRGRRLT